ncbi:methyltransferase domain-containing protein [Methylobacter sp.]|uniref:class I SAM-dependent methyltransferase n=1 Tax=Methylobacter sp. TaxID=2051955 RepID=UPI002489EE92|nr:methyltransferase domain-containing protein [Methylobacter sp.]MDI1276634.1 methyltransferase domain-containing protein [Methylobacter sp.]MDI1357259.1 methyltransferase domain-containing protein [Methylobacter sp.]
MKSLFDLLRDPSIENIDVDGKDRLVAHSKMLARKRMLREVFTEFHHVFRRLDEKFIFAQGLKIELGAGIAPIRDSYSDVLATDVVHGPHLDRVLDAEKMDLPDGSVRVIYGQNCFHHFPHPDKFFVELERVLAQGGGVILLEPYYGPFATFLFKRLFKTEGFDKRFPSWETPIAGPMNGANQALSYIVFVRDRVQFEHKHPTLKIVHQELCRNHMKYLLSGGLNFRQLLPDWMNPVVEFFQLALSPFNRWTSLHHIVIIRKETI